MGDTHERALTRAEDATPAWLTRVLKRQGALEHGAVAEVSAERGDSAWSSHARLRLTYTADAQGARPQRLFLKLCAGTFSDAEVAYYTTSYAGCEGAPIPRCYDAQYRDAPERAYHLLLEDLTETHADLFHVAPDRAIGCSAAEGLARLHAHHWGVAPSPMSVRDAYRAQVRRGLEPLRAILSAAGDPDGHLPRLERVFSAHAVALDRRLASSAGVTRLHGDLNPGNVLAPKAWPGRVHLIDHQPFEWSLVAWLAAADLANMMTLHWDTEARRAHEREVLRAYQRALRDRGVVLAWDTLWDDYRLCVVHSVEAAVEWLAEPADRADKRWLWELLLGRAMRAYEDLGCAALLGE